MSGRWQDVHTVPSPIANRVQPICTLNSKVMCGIIPLAKAVLCGGTTGCAGIPKPVTSKVGWKGSGSGNRTGAGSGGSSTIAMDSGSGIVGSGSEHFYQTMGAKKRQRYSRAIVDAS